jgi:two-component system, LytTR family, response regulator
MKYNCVIIDDEELARELIETHLSKFTDFRLVASCESAIEAQLILKENKVDLIFLDIEMPLLKGIDFVNSLEKRPNIILTTAHREYALEGYELNVIDYLLKPITFERFFKAIDKFLITANNNTVHQETNNHIYVQINKKNTKIILDEILYIESFKDYINIHLSDTSIRFKQSISSFEKELDHRFIRSHRSFIVNKNKITAFTKKEIEIGTVVIPIGNNYKNNVFEALN